MPLSRVLDTPHSPLYGSRGYGPFPGRECRPVGHMEPMAKTAKGRGANRTRERNQKSPAQDDKLADFDERLGRAKGRRSDTPEATARGNAMGTAFRISSELVVGLFVGGLIGWQLDKWFDTSPVLLLLFFLLGAAAGIWNVIRVALEMQSNAQDANGASKKPGSEPAGR